jgi:hypothetical protein
MRNSNRFSKWMLAAGLALASASALPAQDWRNGGYGGAGGRPDYSRNDFRETRGDYRAVDRMRDQVARDRARLADDYRLRRHWAIDRDRATLARHQRELDALLRDFNRSRDWNRR